MKPEQLLATRVANYLRMYHPDIIYRFDIAADVPLPPHLAKRSKDLHGKYNRGYPDLFIATCRHGFGGLYLELKEGATIPDNEHTQRQAYIHNILRKNGYLVEFVLGYEEAIDLIDRYFSDLF